MANSIWSTSAPISAYAEYRAIKVYYSPKQETNDYCFKANEKAHIKRAFKCFVIRL